MYKNNGLADWRSSAEGLQIIILWQFNWKSSQSRQSEIITKTANKIKYLNWYDLNCKSWSSLEEFCYMFALIIVQIHGQEPEIKSKLSHHPLNKQFKLKYLKVTGLKGQKIEVYEKLSSQSPTDIESKWTGVPIGKWSGHMSSCRQ